MNPPATAPGLPAADNIVLIGPMGSGKSSIARELARLDGRRWVDTDRLIVQHTNATITDIFADHGEEHFRRLETAALRSLTGSRRLIVATGGGIVTRSENVALLQALGCVVWLTAHEDVLYERVSRNRKRPLLHTADPRATLIEILDRRRPLYSACAHFTVDTSAQTHAEVAAMVLAEACAFFGAPDRKPAATGQIPSP